ncbi:TITAN-like protein isoform X4 [Vigna unguiculata]|uniref:TITAN-like protein isoform X4 n=1 Tax=Vigna unguiculata TaxID=3917 RepID=UPI001016497B|nr:TITAN-like protein isoform X4 [Vigna unguiculata]
MFVSSSTPLPLSIPNSLLAIASGVSSATKTSTNTPVPLPDSANAIRHLASVQHMKNLRHFFWKYGAAADQLDAFMFSDDDVTKWERKCEARKDEASEGSRRTVVGPSSDDHIHNQLTSGNSDSFEKNVYSHSVNSYPSNPVLPLQSYTNEYQISSSGLSGMANVATSPEAYLDAKPLALPDLLVERRSHSLPHDGIQWSSNGYSGHKQGRDNGRMVSGESIHEGVQLITQISSVPTESADKKVYSEAPPPWIHTTEAVQMHSNSNKLGKSKMLNPNRVGAAWVEKRKIEMEKEKRGETKRNGCDANWLPNFGRVWQSGSRRESRKEFEREKQLQKLNVETESEMAIKIQPYVSKRMELISFRVYGPSKVASWQIVHGVMTLLPWMKCKANWFKATLDNVLALLWAKLKTIWQIDV